MMKLENRIREQIEEMFLRYGIRSVSMDDISETLRISKKTLYQLVPNKSGLIEEILRHFLNDELHCVAGCQEKSKDPIHELVLIAQHVGDLLKKLSPAVLYDLQKYYPEFWKEIEHKRTSVIRRDIRRNMDRGMELGLYRTDIDPDLITDLYLRMSTFIADEKIFERPISSRENLYGEFIRYHIRGISTTKGIRLFSKYEDLLNTKA